MDTQDMEVAQASMVGVPVDEASGLRDAVRRAIGAEGIAQADVSRESGVKPSVLSQWLAGKYPGDSEAVERALRVWLNARDRRAEAGQALVDAPAYFATPTSKRICDALFWAQFTGDIAVAHGGAGVGKTTAARHYRAENPNVWIVTIAPDTAGVNPMLEEVCETLGLGQIGGGGRRMAREIRKRLRDTRGLLVIDEAQHLTIAALEQLRSIHDATGVGLAFLGNDTVYGRLNGGGARAAQFAQLYSRIGIRQKHVRPVAGDVKALAAAWRIDDAALLGWLRRLAGQPGALRGVTKVLRLAATQAGGAALSVDLVEATRRRLSGEAPS